MLLERLGPNLDQLGMPLPQMLRTIATSLGSFWRRVAADCGLPSGADKAAWLADYITTTWKQLGQRCQRGVIDRAVAYCDERAPAFDPAQAVLVHGDAHGWNTLPALSVSEPSCWRHCATSIPTRSGNGVSSSESPPASPTCATSKATTA